MPDIAMNGEWAMNGGRDLAIVGVGSAMAGLADGLATSLASEALAVSMTAQVQSQSVGSGTRETGGVAL